MDFFKAQEQARKKTRWLVVLFALAVMVIIALVYLASIVVPYAWREPELRSEVLAFGILPLALYLLYRAWHAEISFSFIMLIVALTLGVFCFAMFYQAALTDSVAFWEHPDRIIQVLALWVYVIAALALCYAFFADDQIVAGIMMSFACIVCTAIFYYYDQFPKVEQQLFSLLDQSAEVEQQVFTLWDSGRFLWVCLCIGGSIVLASLYKIWQISRYGGRLIAELLDGRVVTRDTKDSMEKRLVNVIEEMSIAAGIPAPVAYVLTYESSLNAFAAGLTTRDCVIGVTQGLLETMTRDELQGVIAHEVSHIVNGDSRLNLRIIGVLYGIHALTLMGRSLMRMPGVIAVFGHAVCMLGFIGVFFGRIIQAALSRQREYLADAAAVQFTRYPGGLISALQKLLETGSAIDSPQAVAASHLFLGVSDASDAFHAFLFDTHPSLTNRIRRLGGARLIQANEEARPSSTPVATFAEEYNVLVTHAAMPAPAGLTGQPKEITSASLKHVEALPANRPGSITINLPEEITPASLKHVEALLANLPDSITISLPEKITSESLNHVKALLASLPDVGSITISLPEKITSGSLNHATTLLDHLPNTLRQQSHNTIGATGILAGLLFSRQSGTREQQEKLLPSGVLPVAQSLYQWLNEQPEQGARYRLVWLDLILPTLREAHNTERQQVITLANDLIRADERVTPTKFAIYSLVHSSLLNPERGIKRSELRPEQLDKDISDLLALLAYAGHTDAETTEAAYQAAIACSPAQTQRPIPAKSELSLNKIAEVLFRLAFAAPPYREKLLIACEVAVQHDGKITPVENELLRAIKQSLDCPAPLIV
ncbi:MAG: M48 family metallopeptidase [Betaproteobacteria bacterium]|nr:M48 family metallopeptidase [Betaproteobacteria bacterium]